MQYLQLLSFVLILSMGCDAINYEQGNGEISSEKRLVDSFSEIQLTGNFEIGLKQGPKGQLVIVTDSNLLKYIDSEVVNDVLIVESSKNINSKDGVKIYVTYQILDKIRSVGASIISTDNAIVSDRFQLELPGAGIIDLEVEVADLEVNLAGAGMVKLKGTATNQSISLNGVGSLEAFELESQSCKVTVSGMGSAEINVKENLDARVNGIGSIKYKGNPGNVEDKISGVGTITPFEEGQESTSVESI